MNKILIYLKVGQFLHYVAFISFIIFLLAIKRCIQYNGDNTFIHILNYYLVYQTAGIAVFAELDARSRFQNYKQVKYQIKKFGYRSIIIKPMIASRCQRDAAYVACLETGYGKRVKELFYIKGYRWYHVFPDFVFSKPQYLFTWSFWKTTFFVPAFREGNYKHSFA